MKDSAKNICPFYSSQGTRAIRENGTIVFGSERLPICKIRNTCSYYDLSVNLTEFPELHLCFGCRRIIAAQVLPKKI